MAEWKGPTLFDFGLTSAQEARARRLYDESIVIDMLYQGPVGAEAYTDEMISMVEADFQKHHDPHRNMGYAGTIPARMATQGKFPAFKEWWDNSGITAGNRQLGMDTLQGTAMSMAFVTMQFDHLPWLVKALHAEDIRRAKAEGKHAGFVTCQNTLSLGQDVDNIDMLYDFGLRVIQLTYNSMNLLASGCTERTDAGVSTFGAKCIERMNKLGIVVDTGHCGHQTTLDACEISKAPVIASHTCARGVSGHARGKSDDALQALARTGGVIGVVTVPFFLSQKPGATMNDFLDHVDYIVKLVGPEHVGIGTDWPMNLPALSIRMLAEQVAPNIGFRPEDRIGVEALVGASDYRDFVNMARGLVARGYSDEQVKGILGGNWLRVAQEVWK